MKKLLFICCAFALFSLGCDEISPKINPIVDQGDCPTVDKSLVNNQERQVLIEEFTGVRCVNCPAGSEAIEDLIGIHGDRLIAISLHAGFFSNPYPQSLYDFQTPDGDNILSFLGEPLGFPTAVVNRHQFAGEENLQVGRNSWPDYVAQELAIAPKAKLAITPTWDETSRDLKIEVSIFIEEDIEEADVRLSVVLTEDDVKDVQLTPAGIEDNYKHKHVFRDAITNYDGNTLTEDLTLGSQFCKVYNTTLDAAWNADNCHLIAFIHLGGTSKQILQAVQTDLK